MLPNHCRIGLLLAALLASAPLYAADTAITIYSKAEPGAVDANSYRPVNGQTGYSGENVPGYAIIRQLRDIMLTARETSIRFSDVAALIDPTTVQFKSLTDPESTKVVEQDYQFDLVSQQKLLEKYIDKRISVEKIVGDKVETVEGTLLSTQGGLMLKTADGTLEAVNSYSGLHFSELPGGLITKPTLVWNVRTDKPGAQKAEVSYETGGMTWWADYNLTYRDGEDANTGLVDFGSWVSIINQTGTGYHDAKLKLIAGDVERAQPQRMALGGMAMKAMGAPMAADMAAAPRFDEKSFFEYHLYTLNRPVNLPDNSTKQLELIPFAAGLPVEKELIYYGQTMPYYNGGLYTDEAYGRETGNRKIDIYLKIKNDKETGLGVPLPAGRVRVSQKDEDGSLEFIGESVIGHTAQGETLRLKLGQAFDVVGERKQVSYHLDTLRREAEEEIEIKLRNRKKQAVKVQAVESLYRALNWEIVSRSQDFVKENAHQIRYTAEIAPEKEAVITYKVRYSW